MNLHKKPNDIEINTQQVSLCIAMMDSWCCRSKHRKRTPTIVQTPTQALLQIENLFNKKGEKKESEQK